MIIVLDSSVDSKSDALKSGSQTANLTSNWEELEKKATKASDSEINQLTKTLAKNWTNATTLSNLVTLPLQAGSALTKLTQSSSDAAKPTTKLSGTGTNLLDWFSNESKPASEEKTEAKAATPESNLSKTQSVATASESRESGNLSDYVPQAVISATEFIFGALEGARETAANASIATANADSKSADTATKPIDAKSATPHTTPSKTVVESRPPRISRPESDPFLQTVPPEFQPQLKVENGKLVYTDPLKAVRIEGSGDRRLTAIIADASRGNQTQLFANPDGDKGRTSYLSIKGRGAWLSGWRVLIRWSHSDTETRWTNSTDCWKDRFDSVL